VHSHGDILAIGENSATVGSVFLDKAEDVVPAKNRGTRTRLTIIYHDVMKNIPSTVETRRMITELEQNLLHLEGGRKSFNENGRTDGVQWETYVGLRENEDVVPKAGFEIMFHLGKIEVRTRTALDKLFRVVIEKESKVED
jgi:hypothetical protein